MKLSARSAAVCSRLACVVGTSLLACIASVSVVHAQGTAGAIFGHGPAGGTVTATGGSGAPRHATIDGKGRYSIGHVGMGTYAVSLDKDGQTLDTRKNVNITVGRGQEVDFACPADKCTAD